LSISSNVDSNSPYLVPLIGVGIWVDPTELLERLCTEVQNHRNEGNLNSGQANSLCTTTRTASRAIARGQAHVAVNVMNTFINQTEDFIVDGILTPEQGQPLIDEAEFIISLLNDFGVDGKGGSPLENKDLLPKEFYLAQNHPNPFNAMTTLAYGLPEATRMTMRIYNFNGRGIATLVAGSTPAGNHKVIWNANGLPSGIYLVHMKSGKFCSSLMSVRRFDAITNGFRFDISDYLSEFISSALTSLRTKGVMSQALE